MMPSYVAGAALIAAFASQAVADEPPPARCASYPIGRYDVFLAPGARGHSGEAAHWYVTAQCSPSRGVCTVYNKKTGKTYEIPGDEKMFFAPHDRRWAIATQGTGITLLDSESGAARHARIPPGLMAKDYAPETGHLLLMDSQHGITLQNLATGATVSPPTRPLGAAQFARQGQSLLYMVSVGEEQYLVRYDLRSGRESRLKVRMDSGVVSTPAGGGYAVIQRGSEPRLIRLEPLGDATPPGIKPSSVQILEDGRTAVFAELNGHVAIRDLSSGKTRELAGGPNGDVEFSRDGSRYLMHGEDGRDLELHDSATGKLIRAYRVAEGVGSATFSPDGKSALAYSKAGIIRVDLATGEATPILRQGLAGIEEMSPDGSVVKLSAEGDASIFVSTSSVCLPEGRLAVEGAGSAPCPAGSATTDESQAARLEAMRAAALCEAPFDRKAWDAFAPVPRPVASGQAIPAGGARNLLRRFSKPGGFNPREDLEALVAILKSPVPAAEPDLTAAAMANVLLVSNSLYDDLVARFPELSKARNFRNAKPAACAAPEERAKLESAAAEYVKARIARFSHGSETANWAGLSPLIPILSGLSDAQKDELIDGVAQSLADGAIMDEQLRRGFISKYYKLTTQYVNPFFGRHAKPLTDLTYFRTLGGLTPVILGTDPIGGRESTRSRYGFSFEKLGTVDIPDHAAPGTRLVDRTVDWSQEGRAYHATLAARVGRAPASGFIPQGPAPRYDQMLADGERRGMIIVGSNMKGDASNIMDEVIAFYRSRGFAFDAAPRFVADMKGYLEGQISSGGLDYFVKEAHSDGDEKNVFRMDREGRILTGTLTRPDGKKEVIELAFPAEGGTETVLVPNAEFGAWVRKREGNPPGRNGQFVYFNSSCNSVEKARHEVEAARTSLLLDIPDTKLGNTFQNLPESAMRAMLGGFLDDKSYAAIRQDMLASPLYRAGEEDVYIFPDEPPYDRQITRLLSTPLDVDLRIAGPDGNPYSMEQ